MTPAHRPDDPPLVTFNRSVPLTWVIFVLALGFGHAATLWFEQKAQREALIDLKEAIKTTGAQQIMANDFVIKKIGELSEKIEAKNLKDMEHDMKIQGLESRVVGLERRDGAR